MNGIICFTSFMMLWLGIETLPIWAIVILLGVFGITSKKYWVK